MKRSAKRMGLAVDRHRALLHRLEQRRLGLGRGAVDLVGEQQFAEDRPAGQREGAGLEVEQVGADDVARHQVGRELDAAELEPQRAGETVGEQGLGGARRAFEQDVAAGEQARSASARPSPPGRRWPCRPRLRMLSARARTSSTRHWLMSFFHENRARAAASELGRSRARRERGRRASVNGAPPARRDLVEIGVERRAARGRTGAPARARRARRGRPRHKRAPSARLAPRLADQRGAVVDQRRLAEARSRARARRAGPKRNAPCNPASKAATTRASVIARKGGSKTSRSGLGAAGRGRSAVTSKAIGARRSS